MKEIAGFQASSIPECVQECRNAREPRSHRPISLSAAEGFISPSASVEGWGGCTPA
jgi:hypothetical protein